MITLEALVSSSRPTRGKYAVGASAVVVVGGGGFGAAFGARMARLSENVKGGLSGARRLSAQVYARRRSSGAYGIPENRVVTEGEEEGEGGGAETPPAAAAALPSPSGPQQSAAEAAALAAAAPPHGAVAVAVTVPSAPRRDSSTPCTAAAPAAAHEHHQAANSAAPSYRSHHRETDTSNGSIRSGLGDRHTDMEFTDPPSAQNPQNPMSAPHWWHRAANALGCGPAAAAAGSGASGGGDAAGGGGARRKDEGVEFLVFRIIDTGVGLSKEDLRRIFEPCVPTIPRTAATHLHAYKQGIIVLAFPPECCEDTALEKGRPLTVVTPHIDPTRTSLLARLVRVVLCCVGDRRFSQAKEGQKNVYGGTGLGLAICKRLAHAMARRSPLTPPAQPRRKYLL